MRSIRSGNSTRLVRPMPAIGTPSWDGVAPITFTVLPAGHPPGLYQTIMTGFLKVAAAAGTHNCTVAWDQPNFGATSLPINLGAITTPTVSGALRVIRSSGLGPITFTWATVGLSGSPDFQLSNQAQMVARPFIGVSVP